MKISQLFSAALAPSFGRGALEVGQEVCYEGFIMDVYCSDVGFFPHQTRRTLQEPEIHTVHCLIDDVLCIQSGFEVLKEVEEQGNSTSPYCRAYRLDQAGNEMVAELAKSIGVCDDCNADTTGEWVAGFRATVKGTIDKVGNENVPAILAVTEVLESSVGCDGAATEPDHCIFERPGLTADDSPCHLEGDYCKDLGETKPGTETSGAGTYYFHGLLFAGFILSSWIFL